MKTVWVLTFNNVAAGNKREVFGVFANEDSAVDSLNDEILLPFRNMYRSTYKDEEQLWNALDPKIEEYEIR